MGRICLAFCVLALAACSDDSSTGTSSGTDVSDSPKPHYAEKEGDKYLYIAELSEDDKKAGKGAPDVTTFRYMGNRRGIYTLQLTDAEGTPIGTVECTNPCRIVTVRSEGDVEKSGFNPETLMGAALEDAFNGFLEPSKG